MVCRRYTSMKYLKGSVSPSIYLPSSLKSLDIIIRGSDVRPCLSHLTDLQRLDVRFFESAGALPELPSLQKLRILKPVCAGVIRWNIHEILGSPRLRSLKINTSFKVEPYDLSCLTSLASLTILAKKWTSSVAESVPPNLQSLTLRYTRTTRFIASFKNLGKLCKLTLRGKPIFDRHSTTIFLPPNLTSFVVSDHIFRSLVFYTDTVKYLRITDASPWSIRRDLSGTKSLTHLLIDFREGSMDSITSMLKFVAFRENNLHLTLRCVGFSPGHEQCIVDMWKKLMPRGGITVSHKGGYQHQNPRCTLCGIKYHQ
jgi:hypothetical protein